MPWNKQKINLRKAYLSKDLVYPPRIFEVYLVTEYKSLKSFSS